MHRRMLDLEQHPARPARKPTGSEIQVSKNSVPRELVLNLLAQGYPLEELLEFFPMFTLDQLMLLLDDQIIQ